MMVCHVWIVDLASLKSRNVEAIWPVPAEKEAQQEQALEEKFNTMQHLYSPRFVNRKNRPVWTWCGCKMQLLFDSG